MLEELHDKQSKVSLVFFSAQLLVEIILDEEDPVARDNSAPEPADEAVHCNGRDEHHPEPHEEVDHLVEEVDWEHALHRVALNVAQTSHLEVAEGDSRKTPRAFPVGAVRDVPENFDAVHIVIVTQEKVQQEQLADDVNDKEELNEKVEAHEITSSTTGTAETAGAGT